ncbi:putative ribonuclease H protein [Nymphaea thermarum]|nr:putative ribonuclease H protein [Nymphaea thermarum]
MSDEVKDRICATLGWPCDALPMSYLGMPLFVGKQKDEWCQPLINKVQKRLSLWKSATLSYVGRLCLLKHVLSSIIGFWSSVFALPKKVSGLLAASMANFLWGGEGNSRARHLIAWDQVCKPYSEGGDYYISKNVLRRLHMPKPQLGSGLDVLHYDGRSALEAKTWLDCVNSFAALLDNRPEELLEMRFWTGFGILPGKWVTTHPDHGTIQITSRKTNGVCWVAVKIYFPLPPYRSPQTQIVHGGQK